MSTALRLQPCQNCNHSAQQHFVCTACFAAYCEVCQARRGLLFKRGACPRCHGAEREPNRTVMTDLCYHCGALAGDAQFRCQSDACGAFFCAACGERSLVLRKLICPSCESDRIAPFRRRRAQIPGLRGGKRRGLSDGLVQAVMQKCDFRCAHCGALSELQVDHIVPHSRGGSDALDNLQILCGPCNRRKGNLG